MKTVETKRCILREWQIEDAPDVYAYAKNELVGPNAGWKPHADVEESKQIVDMFIREGDTWAIVDKETDHVIGSVGLHKSHKEGLSYDVELGYVLSPAYWGKGIMPEVAQAAILYAKQEMNVKHMIVCHFPGNEQSKRVIEKLGFVYVTTIHNGYHRYDGTILDELVYEKIW